MKKPKKAKLKFQVRSEFGGYWWRCRHKNGAILIASETFTRRNSAIKSMLNFISAVREQDYQVEIDTRQVRRPVAM